MDRSSKHTGSSEQAEGSPTHGGNKQRGNIAVFEARLSEAVGARFERISGLRVVVAPLVLYEWAESGPTPPRPRHPSCKEFLETDYCLASWREQAKSLREQPEVHWHRCKFGLLCATVPVVWCRRCLAACQLVCPDTMQRETFEHFVELLDVLCENLVLRNSQLLSELAPPTEDSDARPEPQAAEAPTNPPADLESTGVDANLQHPQIGAALAYIERHLTDPTMTVASIARALDVNATYLAHLFSVRVGRRMSRHISTQRIELAKLLLSETDWQIKRVAFETGHGNPYWFSEVFREHTGTTPSVFRREARSD